MLKKLLLTTVSVAAISGASMASAASYNFVEWIAAPGNGEQGFANSSPFSLIDDGLTLTATAWHFPRPDQAPSTAFVYLDGVSSGRPGGMGVCSIVDSSAQCDPSSDDNVSIDDSGTEVLAWKFDNNITQVTLELGDANHYDFNEGFFQYRYGSEPGDDWLTPFAQTDVDGMVTLNFDGSRDEIRFRAVGNDPSNHFYIRNATVAAVPIPAAAWLFGSALIGLAGVARKRKLS